MLRITYLKTKRSSRKLNVKLIKSFKVLRAINA